MERRYPVVDLKEVAVMFKQEKLSRARPWTAISGDYLTARELLSLIGIHGKRNEYRRTLWLLGIASARSDGSLSMPEYLKKCFREGIVRVHLFRGSPNGVVTFEYRIPIESLDEKYAERAKTLASARNGKTSSSITLSRHTFRQLTLLSATTGKGMSEMVEEWVRREIEIMFAKPQDPVATP